MKWKYIDFDNIPGETKGTFGALTKYRFNDIINYDKNTFFLLGDDSEDIDKESYLKGNYDDYDAIVYATDDFGETWKKTVLQKGSVVEGVMAGKNLFVLVKEEKTLDNKYLDYYTLYRSKDFGNSFEKMNFFDSQDISEINFYSENNGIARFVDNGTDDESYSYTQDGGKTWKSFDASKIGVTNFSPYTYYITSDFKVFYPKGENLMVYDILNDNLKIERSLPIPSGMKVSNESLGIDYKDKEPYVIFESQEEGNEEGELFYFNKNKSVKIKTTNSPFFAVYGGRFFFNFEYERTYSTYYWSEDAGETWYKEKIKDFFTNVPSYGYADKGYLYLIATMYKGSQQERGPRFAIGRPIYKEERE